MINSHSALERPAVALPSNLLTPALVLVLPLVGYLAAANLRIAAATAGGLMLAAFCATVAFERPRFAIGASFAALLVAGTKFRVRDAADSLAGMIDWQVALELGLYALVGVALLAIYASGRFDRKRVGTAEGLILTYVCLALISATWSQAPALTLVRSVQLLIVSAIAILAVRILSPSRTLWTICTTLAVYVLACSVGTLAFAPEPIADIDTYSRFGWFAVHPITVGTFSAVAALGLLSASLFPRAGAHRIMGVPRLLILGLLLAVMVLANARGPLLAFIVAATTLIVRRTAWGLLFTLLGTAAVASFAYLAAGGELRAWLAEAANRDSVITWILFRDGGLDGLLGLNGRLTLWTDLGPAIASNPIMGVGYQASRAIVLDAAPWAAYAHNALLQTTLDLGIIGVLVLMALLATGFIGSLQSNVNPWRRSVVVTLLIFLSVNAISTESFAAAPGFETLLLLVCVLCGAHAGRAPQIAEETRDMDP